MIIGRLNQRIVLYRKIQTQAADGQMVLSFSSIGEFWAQVKPTGGVEQTEAQEKTASKFIEVTIRTGPTFNETSRIEWRGETYNITSIDQVDVTLGSQKGWKIIAKAKDS